MIPGVELLAEVTGHCSAALTIILNLDIYIDPAMNAMYDVLFLSVLYFQPFSVPCVPWLKTVQLWFGKLLKSNKLKFPKLIHNRKKNPTWQDILYFVDISSPWFAIQIVQSQPKLHYHNFLREVVSGISMWR